MTNELKPCRVCGHAPDTSFALEEASAFCTDCGYTMRVWDDGPPDPKVELISRWNALNTRPTVRPAVKKLEWVERRNNMLEGGEYQVCCNGSPHSPDAMWRVRRFGKVICKQIKGVARAIEWVNNHNEKRILSCLEDTPADPWQPIETAPRDGFFFEAWHVIHKCWVSVKFLDTPWSGCELIEKTMTNTWPLVAFSYWKRSAPPTQEGVW